MVKHIVMWKLKEFAEKETKDYNAKKMKELLEGLKDKISEIKSIEVGINISTNLDVAYDVVLIATFNSQEDLHNYKEHPEHVKVANFIRKVREDVRVVDFEVF